MSRRLRKGDMVAIISGNDKGKRGRVLKMLPDAQRVVVEGVNFVHKHLRRSQQHPQGGRVRKEAAVHLSNVMPIDPESGRPTRVAIRDEGGHRARVAVGSGTSLDAAPPRKKGEKPDEAAQAATKPAEQESED